MNKNNNINQSIATEAKKIIRFIKDIDNTRSNLEQLRTLSTDYLWKQKVHPVLLEYTDKIIKEKYPSLTFNHKNSFNYWQHYNEKNKGIHLEWLFDKEYASFIQNGCVIKENSYLPFVFHVEWEIEKVPHGWFSYIKESLKNKIDNIVNEDSDSLFKLESVEESNKRQNKKQKNPEKGYRTFTLAKIKAKQDINLYEVEAFLSHLFEWEGITSMLDLLTNEDFWGKFPK